MYVGVADDGSAVGLSDVDADMLKINNMLRDGIKPDITLFVQSEAVELDGKQVIKATVQSGTERPYYLVGKGLRPEGVFVRHGTASVPATGTAIHKMIRETDGDSYEKLRSTEHKLTFTSAEAEFSKRKVQFGDALMATLGLTNADKIFTNLAFLLSDQCIHTIKTALFQGTTQQNFKDRQEFSDSLFKQINEVYSYLDLCNKTASTFDGLLRIDTRDYPKPLCARMLGIVIRRIVCGYLLQSILAKLHARVCSACVMSCVPAPCAGTSPRRKICI